MHRKIVFLLSIPVALYLRAQDVTEIRNAVSVYGNNMTQGSARYIGMAGSMGAIGGDISASNTNPAAVGLYITGDIQGTLAFNSYKNISSLTATSLSYKKNNTHLGHLGAVVSIPLYGNEWKFVNIGVSYINQSLDDYVETPRNHTISRRVARINKSGQQFMDTEMFDGHGYNRNGNLTKTNFFVSGNYSNKLYVGLGLNFHTADFDQADSFRGFYSSDKSSVIYDKQYTPYSESSSGFSISAGAIGKVGEILRLGASIESPTWWNIDRCFTEYSISSKRGAITSADIYDERRDFRSPAKATLSAALIPSKNFAFNIDYTIGIFKPKFITQSAVNDNLNNFFSKNFNNLSEFKVGTEYRIEGFRFRMGYAFSNNPFNKAYVKTINGDENFSNLYVGKRDVLGLGVGYDFRSFYINTAYQNVKYNYNSPFLGGDYATINKSIVYGGTRFDTSIVSAVKNKQDNILITVGYRF